MNIEIYDKMYQLEKNNWWFRGRRKIFLDFLDTTCKDGRRRRILDVGCGTGIMLGYLAQYGQVKGVDISKRAIAFCQARGFKNVHLGDAQKLPFPDNSFDVITAFDILEHIKDDQEALKEFFRVLRPGSFVLLSVPAFPIIWSSHDEVLHHFRRYSPTYIKKILRKANLKFSRITYFNTFLFFPAFIFRGSIALLNKLRVLKEHVDLSERPSLINNLLTQIFNLESTVLRFIDFPFGLSLLVKAEKR